MGDSQILQELRAIKEDLEYIKEHMVDVDMVLTPEEERILEEGIREHKEGKTVRLEELKRE